MFRKLYFIFFVIFYITGFAARADIPLATDSRIKTYVYNPNDVFLVIINSGFQTSIEFDPEEKIQLITLGDTYSWSLNTVKNRLFIKPVEDDVRTNMTVITYIRSYQFDIVSSSVRKNLKDIAYVVRFYYPK